MRETTKKWHLLGWLFLLVLIIAGMVLFLNREWVGDFYRGVTYQPSSEMVRIRGDLELTERGEFLFNAAQPELNGRAEFNEYCLTKNDETAVLGCYTGGNIYVYDITDQQLAGIRELTTAHELLHAVWARMSEGEKTALVEPLTQTFEANQAALGEEIDNYETSQKQEELYVRAGTEVKNLPDVLEKHYAEIFKDQDKIVGYYDSYISVFKALEAEMKNLQAEMETMNAEITAKLAEYEQRWGRLNNDIAEFNKCAEEAGCFVSEYDFYSKRAVLMTEQEALNVMYDEINELVETYNSKVEIYNADVLKSEKLNTIINSAAQPQKIEGEQNGQQ